jgi:glutamate carboxypeptidase
LTATPWAALARGVRDRVGAGRRDVVEDLRRLVELETPSGDRSALDDGARMLADWFGSLGRVSLLGAEPAAPHLLVEQRQANGAAPLIMCHYDTVWPRGTTDAWPFAVEGDRVSGPGVLDMKASLVMAWHALTHLAELAPEAPAWRLLITADEEIFNPTSREIIATHARGATAALVLEPPLPDGRLKTARKGHAFARVEVTGRAAHSGVHPELGVSAAHELARIATKTLELAAPERGSIVNIGVLEAGDRANVVAEHAAMELEIRTDSDAEMRAIVDRLTTMRAADERATVHVEVDVDRPPMPRVRDTERLFGLARELGQAVGLALGEGSTGGVSEGNLAQAVGTPTLDGLGARGAGPHTREEHIDLGHFPAQVGLLAGLVGSLGASEQSLHP